MPFFIDFIANLAAGWIGDLLTPYGMTGFAIAVAVTVAFAIYWHRQSHKAEKLGMASWPFIFACFAIAAIAIGGGAFGLGLRFATNENKGVAATSPPASQNDNGPIDLYTGKRIAPQPPILDHKLNREEAQYLIGAIDKLNRLSTQIASLDFPNGLLPPTFASHVYPDGVDRLEPDAIDRFLPIMSAEMKDFQSAFNAVVQIINADSAFKDDLSKIVGEHYLDKINGCVSEYFGALQDFKNENLDKPSRTLANSVVAGPVRRCEAAKQGFLQWRDALPARLKAARKEVESYL